MEKYLKNIIGIYLSLPLKHAHCLRSSLSILIKRIYLNLEQDFLSFSKNENIDEFCKYIFSADLWHMLYVQNTIFKSVQNAE